MTYDLYLWKRRERATVSRGVAFLCASEGLPYEGLAPVPEAAIRTKIAGRFGEDLPFEFEVGSTHVFTGLGHSDAAALVPWFEKLAAELSLEIYDPQVEGPSAADRSTFKAMEQIPDASDLTEDIRRWQEEASSGDPVAMNELGNCYSAGEGVGVDQALAFRWYQRAAAKGFLPALINLAECYRSGDGVDRDCSEAARLYEEAYQRDKCVAAFALGEMHRDGDGVAVSIDRAEQYFTQARANRHPEAYLALKAIGRAPKD